MNRIQLHIAVRILAWTSIVGAAALLAQEAPAPSAAELTREQKEQFLLHAKVLKMRGTKTGVTFSQRATLSDGTLTHDAHVQTVDEQKKWFVTDHGREFDFRDYYGFNVAGYRLNKLLGLDVVPVTVKRKIGREHAAVGWWVDDVMLTGMDLKERGFKAPVSARLRDQRAQGQVFHQLIHNTDPNLGNFVIDQSWKGWIFDFTRAFRRWERIEHPEYIERIGRGFYHGLRELDPADVEREVGPYLRSVELKALLARRDLFVQHFEKLIAERGEAAVLIEGF